MALPPHTMVPDQITQFNYQTGRQVGGNNQQCISTLLLGSEHHTGNRIKKKRGWVVVYPHFGPTYLVVLISLHNFLSLKIHCAHKVFGTAKVPKTEGNQMFTLIRGWIGKNWKLSKAEPSPIFNSAKDENLVMVPFHRIRKPLRLLPTPGIFN